MGEIKSTLELVMERTRNLTLTEEEKREHALSKFKSSLNGLLQKYQERALSLDQFGKELRQLQESSGFNSRELLIGEMLRRLDLGKDNRIILDLMEVVCGIQTKGLLSILGQYDDAVREGGKLWTGKIRERLLMRGISGSAVAPNLEADEEWAAEQSEIREKFNHRLVEEIGALETD
jgi:hypothetical protein